jgi:hypothetical protein
LARIETDLMPDILAAIRQVLGAHPDSFDVLQVAKLAACYDSATYYQTAMIRSEASANDLELMRRAVDWKGIDGLVMEFGVATGRSVNHLAGLLPGQTIFGFDSFHGLPETWRTGYEAGTFAQAIPEVLPNVELVHGWFEQTLDSFVASHPGPVALLHVDCDLYSSTVTILRGLAERIVPGSIIVFDEYFNYPGWRQGEFRAFQEFIAATGKRYTYLGFVPSHQQVCVRIGE